MSVVSEIKKGSKKIKAAQLDRITDISGRYFAEYNSSTGECKNPVAEPITNIIIAGNSTKVNADPDIPNDYIAIEYIESTGKQWIKIDDGKYDCSLTVKFMFTEIGLSSYVDTIAFTNNMRDGKQYPSIFYHKETNKIRSNLIGGDISDPQINTIYELTSYDSVDYNNGYELFECKGVWGANQYSKARIYYVKTHDTNNVLTRDIVPVIRKSDNKPGMYDKVSKQFFVNQGTGEFITGPELPGKILEVDTLTKRGKNLYDNSIQTFLSFNKGTKATLNPNGTWTFEMQGLYDYFNEVGVDIYIPRHNGYLYECEPNKTYYFNNNIGANHCYISFFNKDKKVCNPRYKNVHTNESFTTPSDCLYLTVRIGFYGITGTKTGNYIITDHPTKMIYEPYQQPEVIDFSNQPIHGIGELKDKILVGHAVVKNLIVLPKIDSASNSGITYSINAGVISYEGTPTNKNVDFGTHDCFIPKGTYYLKKFTSGFNGLRITYDDGTIFYPNAYPKGTVVFEKNVIKINPYNNNIDIVGKYQKGIYAIMLVEGSAEPAEFEPYMFNRVYHYHVANKIDLGTLDYNLVTLDGNPGFVAKTVPLNMKRDDTSINDAGYKYDVSLSKDRTFNTYRGSGGPWFRNDAFTRDQQGCDDLKASLSGKYLLYKLLTPYYEDITDTPQGQALLNLAPYQLYTTEFEVNNDGTIEFGYWRQIDPLPDTYTRVKALVSDGNQKITVSDIVGKNLIEIKNRSISSVSYVGLTFEGKNDVVHIYGHGIGDSPGAKATSNNFNVLTNYDSYLRDNEPILFKAGTYCITTSSINIKKKNENILAIQVGAAEYSITKPSKILATNNILEGVPVYFKLEKDTYVYIPIEVWYVANKEIDIDIEFKIQIEEGTQPTQYSPCISSMQSNSLEMSEPKKTLFQNKDNRVLSVDGYVLKYNQLVKNGDFKELSSNGTKPTNWGVINSSLSMEGNYCKVIPTALGSVAIAGNNGKLKISSGHKTLTIARFKRVTSSSAGSLIYLVRVGGGYDKSFTNAENNKDAEIGYFITTTDTINNIYFYPSINYANYDEYSLIYSLQLIDLTDMFGAGNEPTTLDEFYATPQGKLYRGYVEYGYHILGAGEYKSNQLVRNGKDITTGWRAYNSSNISVSYSNGAVVATSLKNEEGYGYPFAIQTIDGIKVVKGNKYLLVVDCKTEREDTSMYFDDIGNQHNWSVGKNWTKHEYIWNNTNLNDGYMAMLIKPRHALRLGETYQVREAYSVNLTELGLDHLTLDELKAQRPDLFVYQPYHETETRYGMILSDGRVHPLTGPLYGLNDIKDNGDTIGKESRKYGSYTFTGDESYASATYKRVYVTPSSSFTPKLTGNRSDIANCIFPNLKTVSEDKIEGSSMQIGINQIDGTIGIVLEKYTDSSDMGNIQAVKDTIIGKTLIYELVTPTTTQTTPASIDMDTSVVNEEYTESFTPVEQWMAKYYSGNRAVLNYIPAVRNSDLKPGMYEVATGEFKTNEGTGEFTYINDWTVAEPVTLEVDENKVEE